MTPARYLHYLGSMFFEPEKKWRHWALVVGVILLSLAPYAQNLWDHFISDDWIVIYSLHNKTAAEVWNGKHLADGLLWRPIAHLLNFFEVRTFFLAPLGYHLISLVVEALAAFFAFLLFQRLFNFRIAVFSLLAFIVAPAHVDNIAWISGRTDALAVLFVISALLIHLRWRQSGKILWLLGSVFFLSLALLSKELLIIAPLLVLLVDRHLPEPPRWRSTALASGLWLGVAAVFYVIRDIIITGAGGHNAVNLKVGLFAVRDLARFAQFYFLPVGLEQSLPWVMKNQLVILGFAAILLLGILFFGRRVFNQPAVRLGLAGGLISLLPVANSFPHRWHIYLASVWFSLSIAGLVEYFLNLGRSAMLRISVYGVLALWLIMCLAGKVELCRTWHQASEIAGSVVQDLAARDYQKGARNFVLIITAPDTLRGAFIMRNGTHQALRLMRPDVDTVVHNLLLAGMDKPSVQGLSFSFSPEEAVTVRHQGISAYDYLLPPDADCDLHPGDSRVIGPAGYAALNQRWRPYLSAVEVRIDPRLLWGPNTTMWYYADGHLKPLTLFKDQL